VLRHKVALFERDGRENVTREQRRQQQMAGGRLADRVIAAYLDV